MLQSTCDGSVLAIHKGIVDRRVHPLDHRGQNMAGLQAVLVGIYANAELASVRGRLEHTNASPSGSSINHIGTLIDLRLGDLAALGGVVPGRRRDRKRVV